MEYEREYEVFEGWPNDDPRSIAVEKACAVMASGPGHFIEPWKVKELIPPLVRFIEEHWRTGGKEAVSEGA